MLEHFRYEIGLFNERKSRDQLRPDLPDEDLEAFSLQGYLDWETDREVVAPSADPDSVDPCGKWQLE